MVYPIMEDGPKLGVLVSGDFPRSLGLSAWGLSLDDCSWFLGFLGADTLESGI